MRDVGDESEVYLPSKPMDKDHILMPDMTSYHMLHSMSVQWPFLSLDIIKDQIGDERKNVPTKCIVLGLTEVSTNNVFGGRDTGGPTTKQRNSNHETISTPQKWQITRSG